jgi:protein gp37
MSTTTRIEWTRSDDGTPGATWNPVTGCTKVSEGCDHCYAETFAERWRGVPGHPFEQGFDVRLWPERLTLALGWRRPRRIFLNSMSDLWHDAVGADLIAQVLAVVAVAPRRHQPGRPGGCGRLRWRLSTRLKCRPAGAPRARRPGRRTGVRPATACLGR